MKWAEKIMMGLECCENPSGIPKPCNECPYRGTVGSCLDRLFQDARKCIQQLEAELEAVKLERDAAVADIRNMATVQIPCNVCKNDHRSDPVCKSHDGDCSECSLHCPCDGCFDDWEMRLTGCNFTWRGVCPGNTEV